MAVYVDFLMKCLPNPNWKWTESCHLFADNMKELHEFSKRLGLKRSWFQDRRNFPHYDLTKNMRQKAIRLGAVEVSSRAELAKLFKKLREASKLRAAD